MLCIGIDPGVAGAYAGCRRGALLFVQDLPNIEAAVGRGTRRRLALEFLVQDLAMFLPPDRTAVRAAIERVGSMPRQGVSSTFAFGQAYGQLHGVLVGLCVKTELLRPQDWKPLVGLSTRATKDDARARAAALWPNKAERFKRKLDHNRAEAALLSLALSKLDETGQ